MWKAIKSYLTFKRATFIITVLIVPFALVVVEYRTGETWLIVGLLFVIVSVLTAFAVEHNFTPPPYRQLRKKHATARSKARDNPILQKYYDDGVARTEKELDDVINERFIFVVSQVPEMSVYAMQLVDNRCVLTFPLEQSEALLTPDSGSAYRYYLAMVSASQRMKQKGLGPVIRIFILNRVVELSSRILQFINKNINDGIEVRVIFEDDLPPVPTSLESLDFGCYETAAGKKWAMLLRRHESSDNAGLVDYIVDADAERVSLYSNYADELLRKAKTFDEVMKLVLRPVNRDLWPTYFAARRYEMLPPHGLSDEDADYVVSSALKRHNDPSAASVLILGFTPKLIRNLLAAKVGNIVSLDQCESKPAEYGDSIKFETGNWLEADLGEKFDAIVFDESINNLSRIQLSLFFPRMARLLKSHGFLVGRVMGRYDNEQANKYGNLSAGQAIERLRRIKGETHDDFAPLIICLMHSKNISFSPSQSVVDCERWNQTLIQLRDDGYISDAEYRNWRLQFDFKLLSPDQDILFKEARSASFSLSETRPVQGAYVDRCPDTIEFFKLYNFENIAS
ncbi:MAG TPA: class I SAM-dependent methyltransferase [Xanthobacteraceae bacterium]|nr:class I SAM-dependent methyltransferase [Xanthobacteraceae bacterium]